MTRIFKPALTVIAALIGVTLGGSVLAQERMTRDQYTASLNANKTTYNAALRACGDVRGATRTACRRDARVARDSANADSRARRPLSTARTPTNDQASDPNKTTSPRSAVSGTRTGAVGSAAAPSPKALNDQTSAPGSLPAAK